MVNSKKTIKTELKRCGIIAIMIITMSGCSDAKKNSTVETETIRETVQETSTAESMSSKELTGNILLDAIPELSDSSQNMGGEVITGQSEIIKVTRADFDKITNEQFTEFVKLRRDDETNDWYAILIDDGMAVLFFRENEEGIYGIWNSEIGISKVYGKYISDEDGIYYYQEMK